MCATSHTSFRNAARSSFNRCDAAATHMPHHA
jgi:hypothetical protein